MSTVKIGKRMYSAERVTPDPETLKKGDLFVASLDAPEPLVMKVIKVQKSQFKYEYLDNGNTAVVKYTDVETSMYRLTRMKEPKRVRLSALSQGDIFVFTPQGNPKIVVGHFDWGTYASSHLNSLRGGSYVDSDLRVIPAKSKKSSSAKSKKLNNAEEIQNPTKA